MKLTAKTTASAKLPQGKADVIHFDDALPGFGFRIRSSGGQSADRGSFNIAAPVPRDACCLARPRF